MTNNRQLVLPGWVGLKRLIAVALGASFILLLGVLLIQPGDPLADFRNADGTITVPGGALTPGLQRLLFGPAPAPTTEIVVWRIEQSPYPTASWTSETFSLVNLKVYSGSAARPVLPSLDWNSFREDVGVALAWIGDAFSSGLSWVVEHLAMLNPIGTASALCGDGASTCTWDNEGADGLWNTATNWSNDTVPAAGDSVLFDATSNTAASVNVASAALTAFTVTTGYSATITVNLAQTATWGAVSFTGTSTGTINTNGFAVTFGSFVGLAGTTLTAGASIITVNGNFNFSAGTFTRGTSTVVIAATSTVTGAATTVFANFTINVGVTATIAGSHLRIDQNSTVTVNGTASGARRIDIYTDGSPASPLVIGGSGSISGLSGMAVWGCANAAFTVNLPGSTYPGTLYLITSGAATGCTGVGASTNVTFSAQGNIIVDSGGNLNIAEDGFGTGLITLAMGANNLTVQGTNINFGGIGAHGITFTSGILTAVNIVQDVGVGYIQWGSGSHVVSGAYTNASTSASWDAGSGTVTFDSATGGTMTFAGANLAEDEFNNVTFTSSAGTPQTFTMATRGIRFGSDFSVSDGTSTTTLATSNLAIDNFTTSSTFTIGAGGILTAGSSTITIAGNWNSSAGTFTVGTSTVVIAATASVASATTSSFYNLTITAGTSTPSSNIDVDNTFTISGGTYAKGTTTLNVDAGLTMSGGDLTSTSGAVVVVGNVNISSAASAIDFGSETWTVSGTWTNATTDSAAWDAGTGTVVFDSAVGGTMTFAGANLNEFEFQNVTFASSSGVSQTFTMATRGLTWSGTLTITSDTILNKATLTFGQDSGIGGFLGAPLTVGGTGTNALLSTSGNGIASIVTVAGLTDYIDFGSEDWTIGTQWVNDNTTSSSWDAGTGTVTFAGPGGSHFFAGTNLAEDEFNNVTFASTNVAAMSFTVAGFQGLRWGGTLTVTDTAGGTTLEYSGLGLVGGSIVISGSLDWTGISNTTANVVANSVVDVTISNSVGGYIDFGGEDWTVSGTWTNDTTDAAWDAGTGTVTFTNVTGGAMTFAGANLAEDEFNNITFTSSAATAQTFTLATRGLRWGGTLTITDTSGGTTLSKATLGLTGGALTISGTVASALTSTSGDVTVAAVSISTATAYIDFGSEAWTVSGTWTNNTTSASWDAGSGTVTFTSAVGGTMTFAGSNLSEDEFNDVTFTSSAGTGQTFTMATRGLRVGALTVSDGSSITTLDTSGLSVDVNGDLTVGTGGILVLNASAVTCSGDIDIDGTVTAGTSTLTLDGGNQTVASGGATWAAVNMHTGVTTKTWSENFGLGTTTVDSTVTWLINPGLRMDVVGGSVVTVNGTLDWDGSSGLITIRSGGVAWNLTAATPQTVYFVDVANSDASRGSLIDDCLGGVDSGGNINWSFPGSVGCGATGGGVIPRFDCEPDPLSIFIVCKDRTQYGNADVVKIEWQYQGTAYPGSRGGTVWIPSGINPFAGPQNHSVSLTILLSNGGVRTRSMDIHLDGSGQMLLVMVLVVVMSAATVHSLVRRGSRRNTS